MAYVKKSYKPAKWLTGFKEIILGIAGVMIVLFVCDSIVEFIDKIWR